jgi:hypothetical protein
MKKAKVVKPVVVVLSPVDNPALEPMARYSESADFLVGNDVATLLAYPNIKEAQSVLFVPPASPAVLKELWPHLPEVTSHIQRRSQRTRITYTP